MNVLGFSAAYRSSLTALMMVLGTVTIASPTWGQLALMERTDGHRRLDFLLGDWTHEETQTILDRETTVCSSSRYAWLPGDVWLRGEATIRGLPGIDVMRGWLQITYDQEADEVVQLWYDNQSSILFVSRGEWLSDDRLVLEGSHEWGGTTRHRRVIYTVISEDEFTREYLVSTDGGETYARRSLARNRRQPEHSINTAFDALEWLVGDWLAQFRPHGEDRPAPTMAFTWGDESRSFLRMSGTQPSPDGRLVPEYESMVVWHPVRRKLVFLGAYRSAAGRVVEDGDVDLLENGGVRLNMRVRYPAGATLPFSAGATAGPDGHTLEFRRTFHREGENGLRGVFRIKRGGNWENPHPELKMDDGYPWQRVGDPTGPP